jgi:FSR family fosmidomycin resistance protein-like MFS transporter
VEQSAWPLIRTDLGLDYATVGLALAVPAAVATLVEPAIGILGDTGRRRRLVLLGAACFLAATLALAAAPGFGVLLAALVLLSPSSGAFVSLSQATLIDLAPGQHERTMARWTLAGSVGVVAGPLLLSAALSVGLGWRACFLVLGCATVPVAIAVRRIPPAPDRPALRPAESLRATVRALRSRQVQRWLVVLEASDLMLDVFQGFLALYFVDVVGASPERAALAVAVWTGAGLVGDALLLPILARVSGLRYLRTTAAVVAVAYPAFLLAPVGAKLPLLALLGLLNSGWYAIPKARLFSELPGQSASAALAVGTLTNLAGAAVPAAMGIAAASAGLAPVMWASLAAPFALLALVPRR